MLDLVLKNATVFVGDSFCQVDVGVKDGKIAVISQADCMPEAKEVLDLTGQYLIPGTIDTHMHVRDPGHVERGNFFTETMCAAAGGVTTIMEHPISVPPQYNVEILENRIKRAEDQCVVDFCFYGAAGAEFPEEITKLAADGRIVAFKSFLHTAPQGRYEEFKGLTMADDAELLVGMTELAKTGLICAFHAENNDLINYYSKKFQEEGRVGFRDHSLSRPVITEVQSVERVLRFAKETGARVEIAHVSTPQAMELICKARAEGQDVYIETCPHYLFLDEEDQAKLGPYAKCNPPLRKKELQEKLWDYINDGSVDYVEVKGEVVFNGVDFGYNDEKIVLHDIKLYAKPGQKIAFVGSTGAGKTTITNLINRFYDIQDGKIRYDGININKIKKADLRRSLGIVLQDTHLFTGTVRDNIRFGKLDATDEEIVAAAKLANADSFIRRLPDGYDTMLTGDGANLSQGQRQLLAIARAAIADPPVLILDEATSSIDTRTERIVQDGMDKLMHGRTTFVIAHRLSTVRNSDCIMVLEQGRIIERGTHDELIEEKGRYYQLYTGNAISA